MDTLVNTIHSQVTVGVAQSSLPFTAATMTLAACLMMVNSLGQGQLVDGGRNLPGKEGGVWLSYRHRFPAEPLDAAQASQPRTCRTASSP